MENMAERTALLSGEIRNNYKDREWGGGAGKVQGASCPRVDGGRVCVCGTPNQCCVGQWQMGGSSEGDSILLFWGGGGGEGRGERGTDIHLSGHETHAVSPTESRESCRITGGWGAGGKLPRLDGVVDAGALVLPGRSSALQWLVQWMLARAPPRARSPVTCSCR